MEEQISEGVPGTAVRLGAIWEKSIIVHTDDGLTLRVPAHKIFHVSGLNSTETAARVWILNDDQIRTWAMGTNWLWVKGWMPLFSLRPGLRKTVEQIAQKSPSLKEGGLFIYLAKTFNV